MVKYEAKNTSVLRALVANRRGVKLLYFGKQGYNWTYFPHDQKSADLQAFKKRRRGILEKSEPLLGLFPHF